VQIGKKVEVVSMCVYLVKYIYQKLGVIVILTALTFLLGSIIENKDRKKERKVVHKR
jgi:hypothetical protein